MITDNNFIKQRKSAIVLALIIMIAGTLLYFVTGTYNKYTMSESIIDAKVLGLLQNVQLKAAYTNEGTIDIFALAQNTDLSNLATIQGKSIPESSEMILGNTEGLMMKKEKKFENISDTIEDYNIEFKISGILTKTNTFADDFHFINFEQYNIINGETNKLFVKFKDANTPKLFYLYDNTIPSEVNIELIEGSMISYDIQVSGQKVYYPLILGYDEAKMMREEKLFTNIGDKLDDFFGQDVIIVGVMKQTNTSMDMMHLVQPNFFDAKIRGVLV